MKNCFIVENEEGKRIDRYLAEQMPDMSRSYIQKIIKDGLVTVSEKPVKANYRLSLYESIKVTIPELKEPEIEAEDIPLDILYEDQDIIVINKPKRHGGPSGTGSLFRHSCQCINVSLRK